jgi:hypothetical protein
MNRLFALGFAAVLLGFSSFSSVSVGQFGVFQPGAADTRAANDNRGDNRGDRVCLYEKARYEGWEQCYNGGQSIADLKGRNNKVSSIRVFGRAAARAYDDTDFRGADLRISDDIPDLRSHSMTRAGKSGTWDDAIQSLRVDAVRGTDTRTSRREPRDGICVYENTRYQGRSECWNAGESAADLTRIRSDWNNRISSIRVFGRAGAELYEEVRFRGERLAVDRDIPDLSQVQLNSGRGQGRGQGRGLARGLENGRGRGRGGRLTWNDQVSSLRVESRGQTRS